jgi:hypothetical protein
LAAPVHLVAEGTERVRVLDRLGRGRDSRTGSRRLYAGHRLANKRAPARPIPEPQTRPGFEAIHEAFDTSTAMAQRLPAPHLTHQVRLFPRRSRRQSSTNAAVGGLESPPAGRIRRATTFISRTAPRPARLLPTSSRLPRSWQSIPHTVRRTG